MSISKILICAPSPFYTEKYCVKTNYLSRSAVAWIAKSKQRQSGSFILFVFIPTLDYQSFALKLYDGSSPEVSGVGVGVGGIGVCFGRAGVGVGVGEAVGAGVGVGVGAGEGVGDADGAGVARLSCSISDALSRSVIFSSDSKSRIDKDMCASSMRFA